MAFQEEEKRLKEKETQGNNLPKQKMPFSFANYFGKKELDPKSKEMIFEKDVEDWNWKIEASEGPFKRAGASLMYGPDAVNMIYLASKDYNGSKYIKDAVRVNNCLDKNMSGYNDGKLNQFVPHIYNKIKEQFKDFGYKPENVHGYIFKPNSDPTKRIKQSKDFEVMVAQNIHRIINDENFTGRFTKSDNLHNAFGSVDFLNAGLDEQGNLRLYMFDTYDFNKGENAKVEAGRRKMMNGDLVGYYTVHEILISPLELDNMLKKYYQQ